MATCRNYLMTLNNPKENVQDYLQLIHEKSKAVYTCGQLEQGESGTPHIQFFMNFKTPVRASHIKKLDNRLHIEQVQNNNGADNYCMKEEGRLEGPYEFGTKPVRRQSKVDWAEIKKNAQEGNLDKIPEDIYVKYYSSLTKIKKDHMLPTDSDHLRGIWIYGPAGSGKSRWVRDECKRQCLSLYPKLVNKWWDGYQGQEIVVMDDIDPKHEFLSQQLKLWTDRYGVILENKGGACVDNYKWFIITSQYRINDIWKDDETRDALKRRIKEYGIEEVTGLKLTLK